MAQLIENPQKIAHDHYLLKIKADETVSQPGQFINIKLNDNDPLIRRPFSIFDHNDHIIEIVVKVIGKGTALLKNYLPGPINILGPLGKGFTIVENKTVLLAGGGVGNAPLFYLAKKLSLTGNKVHMVYGAGSREYIYQLKQFQQVCEKVTVCTDDGSMGTKAYVHQAAAGMLPS